MRIPVSLAILFCLSTTLAITPRFLTSDFIDEINSKQSTWVAGRNFPEDMPPEQLHRMGSGFKGIHLDPNYKLKIVHHQARDELPKHFDARDNWPDCESIRRIRDQGSCGGCWAFASTEVMSDRLCTQSNGNEIFEFTPEQPLTCCSYCGDCTGGYPGAAFDYWIKTDIVSGGDAGSNEGCMPFSMAAYRWDETPNCHKSCIAGYRKSFRQDKHYGSGEPYGFDNVDAMAEDILNNGPIAAGFEVFEDFYSYKKGIYQHVTGNSTGFHMVKLIGWGEEDGVKYWLAANSWNTGFGEKGFFKILKGHDECGIEDNPVAAMPQI